MYDDLSIRAKAKEVLNQYGQTSAPIDVEKICKAENISVIRTNLTGLEAESKRPISGLIFVDKGDGCDRRIWVNEEDIEPRQKFTIAHELGHYYLHIPEDETGVIFSFRGQKNQREREADLFATELLMPKCIVEQEYSRTPFPTASYLANVFCVSKLAMQYRLHEMGLSYIG